MMLVYYLFVFASVFYFSFLLVIFSGIKKKNNCDNDDIKSVTVIIPFRNESDNIESSVESVKQINYPNEMLEVIYVNDNSNDDTVQKVIKHLSENIKLIHSDKTNSTGFKKSAIEKAISIAKGEIIILTDADCIMKTDWVKTLIKCFGDKTGMVVGPVKFREDNSHFSKIQQLEFAGLMLTAAGLIGVKKPVICSSANLAFQKKVFEKVGGYTDNMNLTSGDDELLMQKINSETNYNISFCWSDKALVETNGNKNISNFMQQRRRWASKSLFYQNKLLIISLAVIFMFYFLLTVYPMLIILNTEIVKWIFFISLILKFILEFMIMSEGRELLFTNKNLRYFFAAELFQIPYITIAAILGVLGNYKWKGRKVKR
jgi:cellulose synthase/poly-beta-1,6-N-acetylglucosamine synthase-like glycosyltransferase